jgi:alpha-L-rhamnosidase
MREAPTRLRCERMDNPLGLEESRPRLSWWVNDSRPAELQTGYHIQAARSLEALHRGEASLWDSGRVASSQTLDVVWGGGALRSRDRVWWRVCSYDSDGLASPWSEPARFEMGLLLSTDWSARWITTPLCGSPTTAVPAPRLWRDIELPAAPVWARLYVAALGEARVEVNGVAVSDLEPVSPWSDFARRVPYAVHDVGRLLTAGPNRIAVLLVDGQYCGAVLGGPRQRNGDRPALCLQLEYALANPVPGSPDAVERVVSDPHWRWRPSWLLRADRDDGEEADGRQWLPDWSSCSAVQTGYSGGGPEGSPVVEAPFAPLRRFRPTWPAARLIAEHTPSQPLQAHTDAACTRAVVDFGRVMLGRVRVRLRAQPGVTVTVRYLDYRDGAGVDAAAGVDRYTARGQGVEWFEPQFSLHRFRFAEVMVSASGAVIETVLAREIGLDGVPAGSFDCDHPVLLSWYDKASRLVRMGLALGPVAGLGVADRQARSADLQAVLAGASCSLEVSPLFVGWLAGLAELQQQRGWMPARLPDFDEAPSDGEGLGAWIGSLWQLYRRTGDHRALERCLPLVRRQLDAGGPSAAADEPLADGPEAGSSAQRSVADELIESLWFVFRCMVAARVAGVLGRQRDLADFHERFVAARQVFCDRFVTPQGLLAADNQLGYLLALVSGVLEGDARGAAVDRICGSLRGDGGAPGVETRHLGLLLEVLTLEGRVGLAYRLLSTLPMEHAENELAAAAVADWLQRFVLGLELDPDLSADANAYRRALVQPHPPAPDQDPAGGILRRVRGHLDTEHGRYRCGWEVDGGEFRLQLVVPANCSARVVLPDATERDVAAGEHAMSCAWPVATEIMREGGTAIDQTGYG